MHLVEDLEKVESFLVIPGESAFAYVQSMVRSPIIVQGHDKRTDVHVVPELVGRIADTAPLSLVLVLLRLIESHSG